MNILRRSRAELQDLRDSPPTTERWSPDLLDHLARVRADDLADAPEQLLRHLFATFDLTIAYDPKTRTAHCTVVVADDTLPAINAAVGTITPPAPGQRDGGVGMWKAHSTPAAVACARKAKR